jgi:hypothetical protein
MTTLNASEPIGNQQVQSLLERRRAGRNPAGQAQLYEHAWPPVLPFTGFDPELSSFLATSLAEQVQLLAGLRQDVDRYGSFLHSSLAEVYAHWFGYRDGAYTRRPDDAGELALYQAKLSLEREFLEHWTPVLEVPEQADQLGAADFLDEFVTANRGVDHPLFDYLAEQASAAQLARFLQCEVIRNEVVDDEVAMLVVGLQGSQKAVAAANLWDECGRGRLDGFHTYWLRRLLTATDGWQDLYDFRHGHPWFGKITSNLFAAMLTRPARAMMAYGCFLVFESWVEPHFVKILKGLSRVGAVDEDIQVYFSAHVKIDPRHGRELSDGLRSQQPRLDQDEVAGVMRGALLAAEAGAQQFDHMLGYLTGLPLE